MTSPARWVQACVGGADLNAPAAACESHCHVIPHCISRGGVCSGGLGQTDIGGCADEVIGGLALEFFQRNAKSYPTPQPRAPWNLEPHVAREVFLAMLNESGVVLLPPAQVLSVTKTPSGVLRSIAVEDGALYSARVFVDASYEGDLMARTPGVEYAVGGSRARSTTSPAPAARARSCNTESSTWTRTTPRAGCCRC
mgnify:CR=1 FL=1